MTRAERRALYRERREMRRLTRHPSAAARHYARQALVLSERAEELDPRPPLPVRLRLFFAGVDAG